MSKMPTEEVYKENSLADQKTLRRHFIADKIVEYKCSICGQEPFWNGKELTMILDHINGKNHDNRIENLRWVCPNCNQQLETTGTKNFVYQRKINDYNEDLILKKCYCSNCGKEITKQTKNNLCMECFHQTTYVTEHPTREELKQLIRTTPFVKIAKQYGVSDKAIVKWCIKEKLPYRKIDIKSYTNDEWEKI